MSDLTLPEAREQRNALASRTDVLDSVGALRQYPDDMHAGIEHVAHFFEVHVDAVEKVIRANRDELEADGLLVVTGPRLSAFKAECGLRSRASSLTLLPRRAVLRVGMLLRDSGPARLLRSHLLDIEHSTRSTGVQTLTPLEYALALVDAEKRALAAQAEAEAGAKFKRAIEGGDGLTLREFHKKYFSAITETVFMNHLYGNSYLINQLRMGSLRTEGKKAGTRRDGAQHRHPTFKGKQFFYLHSGGVHGGKRRESTRVRPGEWELKLRDQLAKEGLDANENTSGLFEIEGGTRVKELQNT